MALRVFVVRELYPFTAGGIGRVAANILATSTPEELRNTAVVYLASGIDRKRFHAVYPNVNFVDASPNSYQRLDGRGHRYPSVSAYTDTALHAESVRAMQALVRLEKEHGPLGYVEFGDWGANAFASCQEKRLGLAFQDSILAVRLHSTDSVLAAIESRNTDIHALALHDLERKALADCDLIVGQLAGVARKMQAFYGFADADWLPRLVIHAPPVLAEGVAATQSIRPALDTPIVFSSKIQRLKRPDVFVRGCSAFLRARPDYAGDIVFLAHAFDPSYQAQIQRMIPVDLSSRFTFLSNMDERARAALIGRSVCVFPTGWESFCLAAYEASRVGAYCVVNASNPSFDEESPWCEGINCAKFDGTVGGLQQCLVRVFGTPTAVGVVQVPADPKPWDKPMPVAHPVADRKPLISVIIPHYNLGTYLHRTVDSVLASSYANLEVIIVDDASTDPVSIATIERLAAIGGERLKIVRSTFNRGLAATRNAALDACTGEFVLPLDADDVIAPQFIEIGVAALVKNPAYDFVVPQIAYFSDRNEGDIYTKAELDDGYVLIGEARASGLHMNRYATATVLARAKTLKSLRYREELEFYEDWDLYQRAVSAGHRMLVTSSIQFFYRHRHDSMIHSAEGRARHHLAYHDVLRTRSMTMEGMRVPAYALQGFTAGAAALGESTVELRAQLEELQRSEVVRVSLALARLMQNRAPWLVNFARKGVRRGWKVIRRLRRR